MLRLTLWLIALASLAWFSGWADLPPADPVRSGAASNDPRGVRVYSPRGWLTTTNGDGHFAHSPKLSSWGDRPPTGWCVLFNPEETIDPFCALLDALALAEVRNLHEVREDWSPDIELESVSLGRNGQVVFPTWDIEAIARPLPSVLFDPFEVYFFPILLQDLAPLKWGAGAAVLSTMDRAEIQSAQAFLDSFRGKPPWRQAKLDATFTAHHAGPGRHSALILTAGLEPFSLDAEERAYGVQVRTDAVKHAEAESILSDARTIRASWDLLEGSPQRRRAACLAALSDDDPLLFALAVHALLNEDLGPLPTEAAMQVLEACVQRGHNPAVFPFQMEPHRMLRALPPDQAVKLIERLTRVTPNPDNVGWLLTYGLTHPAAEVRQTAREGALRRLPATTLDWLDFLLGSACEPFLAEFHDRMRSELTREADLPRLADLVGRALYISQRALPETSPTRLRLRELAGWLVLHPRVEESLKSRWTQESLWIALLERLHDSDPEIRRQALTRWRELLQTQTYRPPTEAQALLRSLQGDPFTADVLPP